MGCTSSWATDIGQRMTQSSLVGIYNTMGDFSHYLTEGICYLSLDKHHPQDSRTAI